MDRILMGLFFLLLLGPALWLPSLFGWRFRRQNARVQMLAAILGETGSRVVYVMLGGLVSMMGIWFIMGGVASQLVQQRSVVRPSLDVALPTISTFPPTRVIGDVGLRRVLGAAFSPDGRRLLCGERSLQVWDTESLALQQTIELSDLGVPSRIYVNAIKPSVDGRFVAIGCGNKTIHCEEGSITRIRWDDLPASESQTVPFGVDSVAISSDGKYGLALPLVSAGRPTFKSIYAVDFDSGEKVELETPDQVMQAAFVGAGHHAVLARLGGQLTVYDVAGRTIIKEIAVPKSEPRGECHAIATTPDGRFAVTCHFNRGDESVRLWDLEEGRCVYRQATGFGMGTLVILPDQSAFVVGGVVRGGMTLHQFETGTPLRRLVPESADDRPESLAVSCQGRIAACVLNQVHIWDDMGK